MEVDSEGEKGETDALSDQTFIPQKEIVYNEYLPYATLLNKDAVQLLSQLKSNMAEAVLMRSLRPGLLFWLKNLAKYIRIYGMRFSKEDHIALVKILYDVIVIPNLEPFMVKISCEMICLLLKKRELLTSSDLELQWQPLFKLYKWHLLSSAKTSGLLLSQCLDQTIKATISLCRYYFPVSATEEMLSEWWPMICPVANGTLHVFDYFDLFLPTHLPVEHHDKGFNLWFPQVMDMWKSCNNRPLFELKTFRLLSRLSIGTVGYVDWEPYKPMLFTKFMKLFHLPVYYKKISCGRSQNLDDGCVAVWIVHTLGGPNSSQHYLQNMLKVFESYLQPANFGPWYIPLIRFLLRLTDSFVNRIRRERYKPVSWLPGIPPSHRLTDDDITQFVESVKPCALNAIFSRLGPVEASDLLHHLGNLRPESIIPPVLDKLYMGLEDVTQPHRLTSSMHCVVAIARAIVSGGGIGKSYPEGALHVIPLLLAFLPGIDPNDSMKTIMTLQFIATLCTLIPMVDCSTAGQYYTDLTETEQLLCAATANLEDFVLQFFDRCFSLIESSCLEVTRLDREIIEKQNKEENVVDILLGISVDSILMQASAAIFNSALTKFKNYITGKVIEINVAGRYTAKICCAFVKARPVETLSTLLPSIISTILSLTENEDVQKEENVDKELLFNLLLLLEVVYVPGHCLFPYLSDLCLVLDKTLHLYCKEAWGLSGKILRRMLDGCTYIYPLEHRSVPCDLDQHLSKFLPIRHWGVCGDLKNLNISWHVPNDKEKATAQALVVKYLGNELASLEAYISDRKKLTREEILVSLNILNHILCGCATVLPYWNNEEQVGVKSCVSAVPLSFKSSVEEFEIKLPNVTNIRREVILMLEKLQKKLIISTPDDTNSLLAVITLYQTLVFHCGVLKKEFDKRWKEYALLKRALENRLVAHKKAQIRYLLLERIYLQHECIVLQRSHNSVTTTHLVILKNLLTLATSHYSEVRKKAQVALSSVLMHIPYAHHLILDDVLAIVANEDSTHEEFKGALYVLVGIRDRSMLVKRDWESLLKVWPAVIRSRHSEKPSIARLLHAVAATLVKNMDSFSLKLEIPDSSLSTCKLLWDSAPLPTISFPSSEKLEEGKMALAKFSEDNVANYNKLVDILLDLVESGNLHWKHNNLAITFLCILPRYDYLMPPRYVSIMLKGLIHDSIIVRKNSIHCVICILRQQMPKFEKISVPPWGSNGVVAPKPMSYGIREDNKWLQYNSQTVPTCQEDWDQPRFVHKTYIGYYAWPEPLEVYGPSVSIPTWEDKVSEMSEQNQELQNFFSSKENIDKMIEYFCIEENKGKDKFNIKRFELFKRLFQDFGDTLLPLFIPHLERLSMDPHESNQRCASEIIAGLMCGMKHWSYEKSKKTWEQIIPIIRTALSSTTVETIADWSNCFSRAVKFRDANRYHWLLETLMEDPIRREEGSFLQASRLYMLQSALAQQVWRVEELFTRLLNYVKPHLSYSYENVRERVGSVLASVFMNDMIFTSGAGVKGPRFVEFAKNVYSQLAHLASDITDGNTDSIVENGSKQPKTNFSLLEKEDKQSVLLLKTVTKWVLASINADYGVVPEFLQFLPVFCTMEIFDKVTEDKSGCSLTIAYIGQCPVLSENIPFALEMIRKVSQSGLWRARESILEFLQLFVFTNLCTLMSHPGWTKQVSDLVVCLLQDEVIEVREKAALVLGGLLHYAFISDTEGLLATFKEKAGKKWRQPERNSTTPTSNTSTSTTTLIPIHAGVLGLSAFVSAYPYDVPVFIPDILMILGDHLHDPPPISTIIKKTMSNFKRTHQDDWQNHKCKFTDDQLAVLTDLLVSPSNYA